VRDARQEKLPAVVDANNALGLAIYAELRKQPGNLLISPACLTVALSLVAAGARSRTAEQIDTILPLSAHPEGGGLAALVESLSSDGDDELSSKGMSDARPYQVRLAGAVWVQKGYHILDPYRSLLRGSLGIEDSSVDFKGNRAEACRVINDWISSSTGDRIHRVVDPTSLPARTRLIATSGLYLRASWTAKFYREATLEGPFHVDSSRTLTIPLMHDHCYSGIYRYYGNDRYQLLEKPCGAGAFSLLLLLPRPPDGLGAFEEGFTLSALAESLKRAGRPEEIDVTLPRFRLEANLALNGILSRMGMSSAFEDGGADFSGINGRQDLFLSDVRQVTMLDVNEEGLEAAAAVAAISPDSYGEDAPPVFRADHPFVFMVRDNRTSCIILLGRLVDPSQGETQKP
jgi:serpin B